MQNSKNSTDSAYNAYKTIRNTWGNINPVTKIIQNKKKKSKAKDKKQRRYDYEDY